MFISGAKVRLSEDKAKGKLVFLFFVERKYLLNKMSQTLHIHIILFPFSSSTHLFIQETMADRVALQAAQAELPPEILLWRVCQRHQNPNMGHSDCEPAAVTAPKCPGKTLEFLGAGDNGEDCHDGVPQYGHILQYA